MKAAITARGPRALAVLLLATIAQQTTGQSGGNPNDEGLTDSSSFHRRIGLAIARTAAPAPYVSSVPLVYDVQGRSNELMITLAYGNPQALRQIIPSLPGSFKRKQAEQLVVDAVRTHERNADLALHSPVAAWYLTEGNRLSDKLRAELSANHPAERLQQYLILRYSSVASALQAESRL